jgi:serine/threonine-protein kinase HipA
MKKNQLSIRLYGEQVGILEQTPSGGKTFRYDSNAKWPISIGMPLREELYGEQPCEAYFGGLLPESETVKRLIGKRYGVSANNSFALLKAIGYDCAGAISCHAMDEPVIAHHPILLEGVVIEDNDLYKHIKDLPIKPLFMDVEGLKLSLAGVQDKAAICLLDNQIALPKNGCPTTHILKPPSHYFDGLVENEYFCLKIAKRIGLKVPGVELRKIKDITFLLIERYDRRIRTRFIERIHQEDFCQALSIKSSNKYQNEGGPGFKACFGLLNNATQPAIDRNHLAQGLVFNYLMSNMDAHGKNFSLLHNPRGNISLTPFYDIVCTGVYPDLSTKMAMKIGSKYDVAEVRPSHWEQLCKDINYRYLSMVNLIHQLGNEILEAAQLEKDEMKVKGIYNPIIDKIINFLEIGIDKTLKLFAL